MTLAEVEALMNRAGGACMRLYQRKDGTILTADCAVGAKRRRRKQKIAGLGLSAMAALGYAASAATSVTMGEVEFTPDDSETVMGLVSPYPVEDVVDPMQGMDDELEVIMGEMVAEEPELVIAEGEDEEGIQKSYTKKSE